MCLYIYDRTIQSWTDDIDTYIYIRTFKQSPYLSEDIVSVVIYYRKKIFPNIMIDLGKQITNMWASYIVHQVVDIWEVWETEQDTKDKNFSMLGAFCLVFHNNGFLFPNVDLFN